MPQQKIERLHNNPAAIRPAEFPAPAMLPAHSPTALAKTSARDPATTTLPDSPPDTIPSRVPGLGQSILKRKFRARSFAQQLAPEQRAKLSAWLLNENLTAEDIRKKITAPSPDGFGIEVHPTTVYRLRQLVENTKVTTWISDAMDIACDILEEEDVGDNKPIHDALTSILYARALHAANKQELPESIDKLVNTIAKLERLKHRPERSTHSPPTTTRHRVELSIIPAENKSAATTPRLVEISATPLPATPS